MEDISKQLADLTTRLEYQEHLHREVDPKTNSFVHWNNTATLTVLVCVFSAIVVTCIVIKLNK